MKVSLSHTAEITVQSNNNIHLKSNMTQTPSKPENIHPAFTWLRSQRIESLNLTVEEYRHNRTGALHYHLDTENSENVFLVALRTVPMDSTGVAHILEHTVLCGSERYPVRDPFFMMTRRSLNTFMNAFTSSDWTAYPFASQNRKDFNNLMDVYLDAVFFSRLDQLDFAQEGHRFEFEQPEDVKSPLVYKGVVFNEMKGAMSSPTSVLWQKVTEHLYPATTYHYNSGGEPENIPDLSYEQLKAFYQSHYHPSNAVFMTYGDISAYEHQKKFEEQALSKFDKLDHVISVSDEQRMKLPRAVEDVYALDEKDIADKTHIVLGWLLGKSTSLEDMLQAHLMSAVLLDNSSSPLRHALETTDIGSAPSPLCGLEDSNREMCFMCGIEGSNPEQAEALEKLVLNVLEEVAKYGVPLEQVEAVLHQLELHQREVGGDGHPYGLQLILGGLSAAIHGGDPVAVLNLDPVLEFLREKIKDPQYIPKLVRDNLLNNMHRVRLTLKPDAELSKRRDQAEAKRLQTVKDSLSEQDKKKIVEQAAALKLRQAQQDDPDILPKVGLEDVPADLMIPKGETQQIGVAKTTSYKQGTNGIVYQQVIIDLPKLDDVLIDILPYYTSFLTELGCGDKSYLDMQVWQSAVSGGLSAYSSVRGAVDNVQSIKSHFVFSGKALSRNHQKFNELMQYSLNNARFDELDRIRELMAQKRARREQSITGQGHSLAMTAASCGMSPSAALQHRLGGLAGVKYIKQLDDRLDNENEQKILAEKLRAIHEKILAAPRQFLLVGENDSTNTMFEDIQHYWQDHSGIKQFEMFSYPDTRKQIKQAWVTSTQVNFCAKSYPTVATEHEDAAALTVLGGFLRNGYLHRSIREQGGAYGGGASHEAANACFRFYSYRDPRLNETLNDFDASVEWLLNEAHEYRQLEEAILGVVSGIDKPGSPAGEAKQAFHNDLYGRTADQRKRFRQRILQVKLDDLKRVAEKYLQPDKASVAVITSSGKDDLLKSLQLEIVQL